MLGRKRGIFVLVADAITNDNGAMNTAAVMEFFRSHQCPGLLEYGEYPYVSADEIKKALKLKAAFSTMLDQMQ
ncbi:MAG: hypothetical protein WA231_00275 [Methylocella sp.]